MKCDTSHMKKSSQEERDALVRRFLDLKADGIQISIRKFAAGEGLKFYTFRDWYRDYTAAHELDVPKMEKVPGSQSRPCMDGTPFVLISAGGNHVLRVL